MIKSVSDLDVFKLSYTFAMEIFKVSRSFPREEVYSLTDQVIRSSRSISANMAEGFGKRIYEQEFKKHLIYSVGSLEETKVWISFARDCGYITVEVYEHLFKISDDIGAKLYKLHQSWTTFK
ncbi:MAG: four helix bundle protein [Flavisolibacter sp.]